MRDIGFAAGAIVTLPELTKGWVTINGAHVFINDEGVVERGPKELIGTRPDEGSSEKALETAKEAWDDDRTATAISRQSENLVKTGKALGENGRHAAALLDRLAQEKIEKNNLFRGLRTHDVKNLGEVKKGSEFSVTGLKSFSSDYEIATSYGNGRIVTVLSLSGGSRTINLPHSSVPGGERLTNGRFKVTRITEDTGWHNVLDREVTIRTIEVRQLGIYGRKR